MKCNQLPTCFADAFEFITKAKHPKDIFRQVFEALQPIMEGEKKRLIDSIGDTFKSLALLVHPDKNPKENGKAEQASKRLGELRTEAEDWVKGKDPKSPLQDQFTPVTFTTKKYTYIATEKKVEGGMCTIFEGTMEDRKKRQAQVIIKVPHDPRDNDLIKREATVLGDMRKKILDLKLPDKEKEIVEKFLLRIPRLAETIQLQEPGSSVKKNVNIFTCLPGLEKGWFTLEEIRRVYPTGVSTKIMCFIWNRVFEGLTLAHACGIAHCALTPNHIIVHAREHLGQIIDWTAACNINNGDTVPYVDVDRYNEYFPEELLDPKGIPTLATDIYMSAWCMVFLLGGDPKGRYIPATVEAPIREFLNKCLQPNRRLRPQTAESAYNQFQQIAKALWGTRKFVELIMPEA